MFAPAWTLGTGLLAFGVALIPHARGRYLAIAGLRHTCTYPPLWVAGLGGATVFSFVASSCPVVRASLSLSDGYTAPLRTVAISGTVLLGSLILASLTWVNRAKKPCAITPGPRVSDSVVPVAANLMHGSFDQLKLWLANDDPVEHDEDDVLGHSHLAHSVASRLIREPTAFASGRWTSWFWQIFPSKLGCSRT